MNAIQELRLMISSELERMKHLLAERRDMLLSRAVRDPPLGSEVSQKVLLLLLTNLLIVMFPEFPHSITVQVLLGRLGSFYLKDYSIRRFHCSTDSKSVPQESTAQ